MINEKDLGIYVKTNKKFYYLVTGNITVTSHVTRIKKILIQKNLIVMTDASYTDADQYEVLSLKEARQKGLESAPLYLNSHIKKHFEKQNEQSKDNNSSW